MNVWTAMRRAPRVHSHLFLLRGLAVLAALLATPVVLAAEITVTTTADLVNGDVSSPAALAANPGPDGISLREAVDAANAQPGPHTIGFSPALAGQTIALDSVIVIRRAGVSLIGPVDSTGQPGITLDGGPRGGGILAVVASDVSLRRLRIVRSEIPLWIVAGQSQFASPGPAEIANVRVEDMVFTNEALGSFGLNTIMLGISDARASNATVRNVTVQRSSFIGFRNMFGSNAGASNILVLVRGTNNTVQGVSILDNYFADNTVAVELAPGNGSGNRIAGTLVAGNTITSGFLGVTLNPTYDPALDSVTGIPSGITATTNSVIEDTTISGNAFVGLEGNSILIAGGVSAAQCAVRNTRIVNNLITGTTQASTNAISIRGGEQGGTGNLVQDVEIIHNTIAHNASVALEILQNVHTTGNAATGVNVSGTILWRNQLDFVDANFPVPGTPPDSVRSSILSTAAYVGVNGNLAADPKFVNAAARDFRLQADSPALDAADNTSCPGTDRLGVLRPADGRGSGAARCDIGAHESGAAITLALNGLVFRSGETLAMTVRKHNPLAAFEADFYAGVVLPDGATLALLAGGSPPRVVLASLADLSSVVPLTAGEIMARGAETGDLALLSHVFSGGEPPGQYLAFTLWARPGAFRDGRIDPGDIIASAVRPFAFAP